ncbi:MAG: hypothetical protein L0Y67_05360, partial [Gammaproteobacteria bacterium]|nr:hypothetical protein [Gammaproteobacteria bacterium]
IRLQAVESAGELKKIVRGMRRTRQECFIRESFDLLFTAPQNRFINRQLKIGEIGFFPSRAFTTGERHAIGVFTTFLSEYIANGLISAAEAKCSHAISRIATYFEKVNRSRNPVPDDIKAYYEDDDIEFKFTYVADEKRTRSGSVISRTLRVLGGALKPFACYFCVFIESTVVVEYSDSRHKSTQRRNQLLLRNHPYTVNSTLQQYLSRRDIFALEETPFEYGPDCLVSAPWVFVFAPIVVSNSVIGMLLVQYDRGKVLFLDPVEELLKTTTVLVRRQASHLFQRRFQRLVINPYFKGRDTRIDECNVFVLMPFSENWSDRIYKRVLKPTIEKAGLISRRADDLYGQNIMEDIWSGILSARFVVADITARNPNVFYELGIAHTLGKDVIVTTQSVGDIPFDLKGHRCIVYADNLEGCEKLQLELYAHLKNRSDASGDGRAVA